MTYNTNIINIKQKFSITNAESGLPTTLFFVAYGIGQFVNGLLVRKYNIKYVISLSLLVPCILNILVLFTPTDKFYLINIYWFLNGLFIAPMWPCLIRLLVENATDECKDKCIFMLGSEMAIGSCLLFALSSLFTYLNHYYLIFVFAIAIGVITLCLWFFLYDKFTLDEKPAPIIKEKMETAEVKLHFVIYASLCIAILIIVNFIKEGIITWSPSVFNESFNLSKSSSVLIAVVMPIAQFLGVCVSSLLKKHIKSHILVCVILLLTGALALCIGWINNFSNIYLLAVIMFITIICFTGPMHIICDLLPLAWAKERNSGLFAGLFNGCCYIGAASASLILTRIADNNSWNKVFVVISIVALVSLVICALYYIVREIMFKITKTRF